MSAATVTASRTFRLPDLGEGLTEAEIISWRVSVGDTVTVDQIVVEVETAKAVVEVPCPFAGRVAQLHAEPGQLLPVGEPLLTIDAGDARGGEATEGRGGDLADADPHAIYREEERAGSGNVLVGYGTGAGSTRRRRRAVRRAELELHDHAREGGERERGFHDHASGGVERDHAVLHAPKVISPIVRRMALEAGLDLTRLRGTGPGGVIRRADVQAAVDAAAKATATSTHTPERDLAVVQAGGETRIPLRGVRRAIAEKLSTSRREIPDVTIWVDVDATGLLDARAAINAASPDRQVSVLALLARITVHALGRFPELNSRVDTDAEEIVQSSAVHLGVAVDSDRGLVVPVIRDADRMNTVDLAEALRENVEAARAGTLPPARMTGGTFTLNNYGVFGVDGSTPIINHPEAALLGMGRIVEKPWVVDGQLAVRKVTQLSLTFDHRVCDGRVAGGFLRYVADCVENPVTALALI